MLTEGRIRYLFTTVGSIVINVLISYFVFSSNSEVGVKVLNHFGVTAEPQINGIVDLFIMFIVSAAISFAVASFIWAGPKDMPRRACIILFTASIIAFGHIVILVVSGKLSGSIGKTLYSDTWHFLLPVLSSTIAAFIIGVFDNSAPTRAHRPGPFDKPGDGQ